MGSDLNLKAGEPAVTIDAKTFVKAGYRTIRSFYVELSTIEP